MKSVFADASAEAVVFPNPLLEEDCTQTVYLGVARGDL